MSSTLFRLAVAALNAATTYDAALESGYVVFPIDKELNGLHSDETNLYNSLVDCGTHYIAHSVEAKSFFLDFWDHMAGYDIYLPTALRRSLSGIYGAEYFHDGKQVMVKFFANGKDAAKRKKTELRLTRFLSRIGFIDSEIEAIAGRINKDSQFTSRDPEYVLEFAHTEEDAYFATQSETEGFQHSREYRVNVLHNISFGSITNITHTMLSCQRLDNPNEYLATPCNPFLPFVSGESDIKIAYMRNPRGFLCARALVSVAVNLGEKRDRPRYFKIYADSEYSARQLILALERELDAIKSESFAGSVVPAVICPKTGKPLFPYSDNSPRVVPWEGTVAGYMMLVDDCPSNAATPNTSGLLNVYSTSHGWSRVLSYAGEADMPEGESYCRCCKCNSPIPEYEEIRVEGDAYCEDCYCESFFTCDNCGDTTSIDERTNVYTDSDSYDCVCKYCARQRGTRSAISGNYISDNCIVQYINSRDMTQDVAQWEIPNAIEIEIDGEMTFVNPQIVIRDLSGDYHMRDDSNSVFRNGYWCWVDDNGIPHMPAGIVFHPNQLELPL